MATSTVVSEKIPILYCEFLVTREVVHRSRQAITANSRRDAARQMQCVLQTGGQRLEGLGLTKVDVFPVRISKDRMEHQVFEGLAIHRDLQGVHDDEVKREHIAGMVNLWELDVLLDAMLQLPALHASLQRSSNRVGDAGLTCGRIVFLLEPIKNRVGLQSPIVFKQRFDLTPELCERILTRTVRTLGAFDLAR